FAAPDVRPAPEPCHRPTDDERDDDRADGDPQRVQERLPKGFRSGVRGEDPQYVIRSEGADALAGSVLVAVLHPKRVTEQADDRQDNKVGEQQSRQDSYRSRRLLSNAKQLIFYSPLQGGGGFAPIHRSEEHTSELQSRFDIV